MRRDSVPYHLLCVTAMLLYGEAATQNLNLRDTSQYPTASVSVDPGLIGSTYQYPVPPAHPMATPFGSVVGPSKDTTAFHRGLDFTGQNGDPISSIGAGTVYGLYTAGSAAAEAAFPGSGNVVVVQHSLPFAVRFHGSLTTRMYAVYGHLQSISSTLSIGQLIAKGAAIGTMGTSGNPLLGSSLRGSEGVLHLETRLATDCSLEYQKANPSEACASYGFDPAVNPLLFLPLTPATVQSHPRALTTALDMSIKAQDDWSSVELKLPGNSRALNRMVMHTAASSNGAYPDVVLDFNLREGFDASSSAALSSFTSMSWGGSISVKKSDEGAGLVLTLSIPPTVAALMGSVSFYDTWGSGVRAQMPTNGKPRQCPQYFDVQYACDKSWSPDVTSYLSTKLSITQNRFVLMYETDCSGSPAAKTARFRIVGITDTELSSMESIPPTDLETDLGVAGAAPIRAAPMNASAAEDEEMWWWLPTLIAAIVGLLLLIIVGLVLRRKLGQAGYRAKNGASFMDSAKSNRRFDIIAQLDQDGDQDTKIGMTKEIAQETNVIGDPVTVVAPPPPRTAGAGQPKAAGSSGNEDALSPAKAPPRPRPKPKPRGDDSEAARRHRESLI